MTFSCSQCGGKVRTVPGKGRMLGRTPVPDLLGVPTCSECGTMFWNEELVEHVVRANKPSPWCITAGAKLIEAAERRCPEILQQLRSELGIEASMVPNDTEVVKWLDAHALNGWKCHQNLGLHAASLCGSSSHTQFGETPEAARLALAKSMGMGKAPECPLPEDWREWCRGPDTGERDGGFTGVWRDWVFHVRPEFIVGSVPDWTILVYREGHLAYFAPCRGIESGRRAAVKAARRAWKVLDT